MAFDVFISYPHQNKAVADASCAALEAEGIRCWIAPRDVPPGAQWAASIVEAIDACRVMVLIFSAYTNQSRQVHREVQQAFDAEKPVIPFRIENIAPERTLRYYMGSVHWLDALTPPLEQHLKKLVVSVQSLAGGQAPALPETTSNRAETSVTQLAANQPQQRDEEPQREGTKVNASLRDAEAHQSGEEKAVEDAEARQSAEPVARSEREAEDCALAEAKSLSERRRLEQVEADKRIEEERRKEAEVVAAAKCRAVHEGGFTAAGVTDAVAEPQHRSFLSRRTRSLAVLGFAVLLGIGAVAFFSLSPRTPGPAPAPTTPTIQQYAPLAVPGCIAVHSDRGDNKNTVTIIASDSAADKTSLELAQQKAKQNGFSVLWYSYPAGQPSYIPVRAAKALDIDKTDFLIYCGPYNDTFMQLVRSYGLN
jgi:TIR domain